LQDPTVKDPSSRGGKKFRRRFSVRWPVFEELVAFGLAWFPAHSNDVCGRSSVPMELRIFGCLRVLARGARFDNIEELSGMSEETMRLFFHAWTRVMSVQMDDQWITPPRTPEELSRVEKVFNRLGLPGACTSCTSFSCTHVGWDCCPAEEQKAMPHEFFC